MRSRSNWNLEVLVFEERGKPEYPEKKLSEQGREPTTNATHIWRRRQELNLGHIGGRQVLSPLRHPLLPEIYIMFQIALMFSNTCYNNKIIEMTVSFYQVQFIFSFFRE